jgi:hypothetical protein
VICRDDLPPTPDWHPERHACPFDVCRVCETPQQSIAFHLPDSIELGEN